MKVSIIIALYNTERYLEEAVLSALAQPETGEVILVDDGSTDLSGEKADQLAKRFGIVSTIHLPSNHGPAYARNCGIKNAIFPIIAFLDADDIYLPGRFKETLEAFNADKTIDAVYGVTLNKFQTDILKSNYRRIYTHEIEKIYHRKEGNLFQNLARGKNGSIHLDALTVRTSALKHLKGFDESLRQMEDTDLVLRLANNFKFHALPQTNIHAVRRIHYNNTIFDRAEAQKYRLIFLEKWLKKSINEKHKLMVQLYFLRHYLGEHPYSGKGSFGLVKTTLRKSILLINLLLLNKKWQTSTPYQ